MKDIYSNLLSICVIFCALVLKLAEVFYIISIGLIMVSQGGVHNLLNCYTIPQADIQGDKLY